MSESSSNPPEPRRGGGRRCYCGRPRRRPPPGQSYYERTADGRETWALARFAVALFGTHLLCERAACRRAGRCADDDPAELPLCFPIWRGEIRYALALLAARRGVVAARPEEGAPIRAFEGLSVLGMLAEAGAPIEALRRPPDWRGEEWTWERDDDAVAYRAELVALYEAETARAA